MNFQTITPSTTVIDPTVDFFVVKDHMCEVNFMSESQSLDDHKQYFGKNTIRDLFVNQGLNFKDYFFIFDHYLNLDNLDGYFYPNFLLHAAVTYQKFSPDHRIDFTKKSHSVNCVMKKIRPARLLASCWFANNTVDKLLHTQSWAPTDNHSINLLDEILQISNLTDWKHDFGPDLKTLDRQWIESEVFSTNSNEIPSIEKNFFNSKLKQIFDTTVISVVLEPVFWEHGSIATEKYMQAIYSGTIPLVNGYKIYDSLATLGFDTFSDIIDTSSQYELDPILRIWNMLENNKNLFSQWQDLILDKQIQNRIINNLVLLQNPEKIFKNSIKLNSEQSFNKLVSLKESLKSNRFLYLDLLGIPDKLNK